MELYQLRSFIAVSNTRSLRKASEQLHISLSALSSQIRALEEELGVELFRRTPKGMALTENGAVLLGHASKTVDAAQRLKGKAEALKNRITGSLKIGLNTDPNFLRVGDINRELGRSLPGVRLNFLSSQTMETPRMLREGIMDMGFSYGNNSEGDILSLHLTDVEIWVVIPAGLAQNREPRTLGWEEIASMPWIWTSCHCPFHVAMQKKMDRYGVTPTPVAEAMDENIVRELVLDGQGLAMMRPDEALPLAESGRVVIWERGRISVPLKLSWKAERNHEKAMATAAETIRGIFS